MSEPYDQDAEELYGQIRKTYDDMHPDIWVDTETGHWGTDITSVVCWKLVDGQDLTEFAALTPEDRVTLAKMVGMPLRMLGCTHE